MKTAISIPDPLFEAAELLARRLKLSRSQLYARALESMLAGEDDSSVTAQLNTVYETHSSHLDKQFSTAQASAVHEEW